MAKDYRIVTDVSDQAYKDIWDYIEIESGIDPLNQAKEYRIWMDGLSYELEELIFDELNQHIHFRKGPVRSEYVSDDFYSIEDARAIKELINANERYFGFLAEIIDINNYYLD